MKWLLGLALLAQIEAQNAPPPPPVEKPAPKLTKAPELVTFVSPTYPPALFEQNIAGEAIVVITIDSAGAVSDVALQSASDPAFAEPAIEAARKLVFTPAEVDNVPSPIRIEYRFSFEPQIIEPDAIAGEVTSAIEDQGPVNFRGHVREAVSRLPFEGATLLIDGVPRAVSREDGLFEIRGAPVGTFQLRIVGEGRRPFLVDVKRASADKVLEENFYLLPLDNDPYQTVVSTRGEKRETSKVELKRAEVEKVPGTFGDPLRVIENLPGMGRAFGGIGGQLIVRGANPEDTRVYVDGVEVPFLYHFGGLTSILQSQFLDHIDFYPGGFGAKYGRSTAGIVDVGTRILDCNALHGAAKVDFIDSAAYVCAPLGGGWSIAGAARRSYIDLLLPLVLDNINDDSDNGRATISPVYFDYQLKATKTLGKSTFEIFMFGSADTLSFDQSGSLENVNFNFGFDQYFNRTMFRHRYKFSDRATLTSQITGGYQRIAFSGVAEEISLDNRIRVSYPSVEWREQFDLRINDAWQLHAGIDSQFGSAGVFVRAPVDNRVRIPPAPVSDFTDASELDQRLGNYSQGYWVETEWTPGAGIKVIPGFRFERVDFARTQGYEFLPRLNVRWQVLEKTALKAAFGLYEKLPEPQYFVQTVGNPFLRTEKATQYVVGIEHAFTDLVNVDIQGFYTYRTRLRQDSNDVVVNADGTVRSEIYDNGGRGHTYGLQLMLRHELAPSGRFFGWVSYTLSRSVVTNSNVGFLENDPQQDDGLLRRQRNTYTYLSDFDQPHILTIVGQWVLGKGWEAGFRFRLTSGNPYTPLNRGRVGFDADRDVYFANIDGIGRNGGRFPTYHQLDVRVDRTWTYSVYKLGLYLEVLNVYNRRNIEAISYDYRYRGTAGLATIPIIPVLGIKGEF